MNPEARLIAAVFGGAFLVPGLLWLPAQARGARDRGGTSGAAWPKE